MASLQDLDVDHDSAVPLHLQLQRRLRGLISSGQWPPGTRLPSENRIQRELNISRNTVRQALGELENESLIDRIPGRGTFVTMELPRQQSRGLVSIVVGDFESQLDMLSGAEKAARDSDFLFIFSNHHGNYQEEQRILSQLTRQEVSGALLWSCAPAGESAPAPEYRSASLPPLVMLDRDTPGLECDFVTSDNVAGAGMAVRHLQQLGHRHIVCVSHDVEDLLPVAERIQGYHEAMEVAGNAAVADTWVLPTGGELSLVETLRLCYDPDNVTMHLLRQWLTDDRPEAIFAINDHVALLVLRAAQSLGWRVPGALSVIGYDNVDYGSAFTPPLTTVAQDYWMMGRRAMEMLLERIDGLNAPPRKLRIPVTLLVRGTTGRKTDLP